MSVVIIRFVTKFIPINRRVIWVLSRIAATSCAKSARVTSWLFLLRDIITEEFRSHEPLASLGYIASHSNYHPQLPPALLNQINGSCSIPEHSDWFTATVVFVKFHYVYVLLSEKDGEFYIGSTNDLKQRLEPTTFEETLKPQRQEDYLA